MSVQQVTKYVIRKVGTDEYLSRSGTRDEWVTDVFKSSQFHSEPFHFSEIRKIIDSGVGEIVTVRITAEIAS
jgi:hypothetical protein